MVGSVVGGNGERGWAAGLIGKEWLHGDSIRCLGDLKEGQSVQKENGL